MGSTFGSDTNNWLNDSQLVGQIPDDATDNVIFVGTPAGNKACDFGPGQNTLGTISVDNAYTSTIKLGGVATAFTKASILGACMIDLNGNTANFGGTGADPSAIGVAGGARATIKGGSSIEVTNLEKIDLANVNLASSVNVNAGSTLSFGFVSYMDPISRFQVDGGTVTSGPNAQFISSVSAPQQGAVVYNQPINVLNGGKLNFETNTTVVSYIWCGTGTITVQGTQAAPNVTVTITGSWFFGNMTPRALMVGAGGVLNLSPGSTISGNTVVYGGMNLWGVPPGSTATVATIMGTFHLSGVLNLNTGTLNVSGNADFNNAAVTTHVAYGNAGDTVQMGKITVSQTAKFTGTNTLTQGWSGTPKAFSLPVLIAGTLEGEFNIYFLQSDRVTHAPPAGGIIVLTYE